MLHSNKGRPFEDAISGKEASQKDYWLDIIGTDNQEDAIFERIKGYLQDRNLDGPIILDHVYSATHSGLDDKGFSPASMKRYFDRLEKNTSTNAKSCESIRKYCTDTRAHMDRIVKQECRATGVAL